jgi:hypothetical protein
VIAGKDGGGRQRQGGLVRCSIIYLCYYYGMAYGAGADQEIQNVLFLLIVAVFLWHEGCMLKALGAWWGTSQFSGKVDLRGMKACPSVHIRTTVGARASLCQCTSVIQSNFWSAIAFASRALESVCVYCISYYFWQFLIMAVGLIFISFGRRDQWN